MQAFQILLALCLGILSVVADSSSGNFTSNCPYWYLSDSGNVLTAKCNDDSWMPTCSQLDLNQCLENKDGALNWAASGKAFNNGCSSCKSTGYASIQCTCLSSDGKSSFNSVKDLNENIHNHDGYLGCFNFEGANCTRSSSSTISQSGGISQETSHVQS
ncbi:hypothetical protein PG993_001842 [Apiospora rasikravindrae]|uniref:Cyanovirin-N domain-containing protein n=1 Tax=Apiospora rasikravindrae TaxID=990691 RepID=A0ABR1UEX8_9PEZI